MGNKLLKLNNVKRRLNRYRKEFDDVYGQVLESGQLFNGKYTEQLVADLSKLTNYKYVIPVDSGTSALFILACYYRCKYSKALVTPFTYRATHNALKRAGYTLEYLECDVDLNGINKPRKDCLNVFVGLYGKEPIYDQKSIYTVIEDACQSWIHSVNNQTTKAISFDPTKNLFGLTGGGAILTQDKDIYEYTTRFLNNELSVIGLNNKISELDAAVICLQIPNIQEDHIKRKAIADTYLFNAPDISVYQGEQHHDLQKYVVHANTDPYVITLANYYKIEAKFLYRDLYKDSNLLSVPIYPELKQDEYHKVALFLKDLNKHHLR